MSVASGYQVVIPNSNIYTSSPRLTASQLTVNILIAIEGNKDHKKSKKVEYNIGWSGRSEDHNHSGPKPKCAGCKERIEHNADPVFIHKWKEDSRHKYFRIDQWCGDVSGVVWRKESTDPCSEERILKERVTTGSKKS